MTFETHDNNAADQEVIDAFLLGALSGVEAAEFEVRMQEDVRLALAVGKRVESFAALERAAHQLADQQVHPRPVLERNAGKYSLLWLVATVSLVVGGGWLMWPNEGQPTDSIVFQDSGSNVPAEQVIAEVAERWLTMIEEDGIVEVETPDDFDILPVSMDDSWISETAVQTYLDSEA